MMRHPVPAPSAEAGVDEAIPAGVRRLLADGSLDLPLPGRGRTQDRLDRLRRLGHDDLVLARLAEAHTDAVAILADLGAGSDADPEADLYADRHLWGVWAADPPLSRLRAEQRADGWRLNGPKPWCSGAATCDRALVTAHAPDGYRLFAVDPRHPGVSVRPSGWQGPGMAGSGTRDVDLDEVPGTAVGGTGAYLERPGFWWGGAGVAAVWLGGAERVAEALQRSAARHGADLVLASLGRVDAAQHAARCTLAEVARLADAGADVDVARLVVARARATVETAVEVTLAQTGRATGPGPLATDAAHARHVADLQVYVRQSHGDRDLAVLGGLVVAGPGADT